jgi:hypothetical protein
MCHCERSEAISRDCHVASLLAMTTFGVVHYNCPLTIDHCFFNSGNPISSLCLRYPSAHNLARTLTLKI